MRFTAIAVALLACVEAARGTRKVFKRADDTTTVQPADLDLNATDNSVALHKPSTTETLDDIVQQVWNSAAGTVRTALSPDGTVRYHFQRHADSISSRREYLHEFAKMSNAERLKRGMAPRKPGRLYVGPDGRLKRKRDDTSTTGMTCNPDYKIGLTLAFQNCGTYQCLELDINIADCKAGITIDICVVALFGYGTQTHWYPAQGGTCIVMNSCCGNTILAQAQEEQGSPTTTVEEGTPTTATIDGGQGGGIPTLGVAPTTPVGAGNP